jgi:hypothetical protein
MLGRRSLDHAQERTGGCRRRAGSGGAGWVATAGVRPDGVLMLLGPLLLLMVLKLDLVLHFVVIHVVLVLFIIVVVVVFVHVVAVRAVDSVVAAGHLLLLLRLPLLHHLLHHVLWL